MNKILFESGSSTEWETPQAIFDALNEVFKFDIDVCATANNAKCEKYFNKKQDGLAQEWNGTVWCNPPYGREIGKWVKKAFDSWIMGARIVMLLPSRTDTNWIFNYVFGVANIIFLKGRLKFGKSSNSAPFPSMLAIYGGSVDDVRKLTERLEGFGVFKSYKRGKK
jgi:phage N-6-adenine-methyltransferase